MNQVKRPRLAFIFLIAAFSVHVMAATGNQGPPPEWAPVAFTLRATSPTNRDAPHDQEWLCSFRGKGKTARFRLRLMRDKAIPNSPFSIAKGCFIRTKGSDSSELLIALKRALEAKRIPTRVKKVDRLPFDVALLGVRQSKLPKRGGGGFSSTPPGSWTVMKVFVAEGEGEFFLNLNLRTGIGEFSIKDEDYGDIVLGELAKVL